MNINNLFEIILSNNPIDEIKENEKMIFAMIRELEDCMGFNQNNDWHIYDVYEHTLNVINGLEKDIVLRLAALFHDIGKPSVYHEDEFGVGHFTGHWIKSKIIFEKFAKKYNLDEKIKNEVSLLIFYHDKNLEDLEDKENLNIIKEFNKKGIEKLFKFKRADLLAQNPKYHTLLEKYIEQEDQIKLIKANEV